MQSEVLDTSAIEFTETLYRSLARGNPIEAAVADARKALSTSRVNTIDWAAPVLFLRESADTVMKEVQEVPIEPPRGESHPHVPARIIEIKANKIGRVINADVYRETKR